MTPVAVSLLLFILVAAVCIPPAAGTNATATTTTAPTTAATTTSTTSPTATATHTTTQTTVATTTATTTATATATTVAPASAATTATTSATTAATTTATATQTTSTNQVQPVAGFTADVLSGTPPLTVQFTDLSTGGPVSWTWDFGDGGSDTAQNPSHTYNDAGTYTVTLTAVNRQGTSYQRSESGYITVNEVTTTPTETETTETETTETETTTGSTDLAAAFSGSPVEGTGTLTVQFTDLSTGSPDAWSWDFGDATTSTDENPSHVYTNPGLYTVTLEVTRSGETNTTTKVSYITIDAGSSGYATVSPTGTNSFGSQSGSGSGNSPVYSTTVPTLIVRQTQAQANVTPVLTGQAWIDRENQKLAEADALASSGQHTDILSQIAGFVKGIFSWL